MHTWSVIAGTAVGLGLLVVLGRSFARAYLKYVGNRVITCPENQQPAGVRVDAAHALLSSLEGAADLKLSSCSRWPEHRDCGQECLWQIETSPDGCLVRTILSHWYEGKNCAVCGKSIGEIHWADHQPALLNPSNQTVLWQDVPPEKVPEALRTHRPVCWNCHIVSSVVHEHPELVVDRARHI